ERLARHDEVERLQDVGDVVKPAALHLVEVLLVAPLPVAGRREATVGQGLHQPRDVFPLRESPQPDQIGDSDRNHDLGVVRQEAKVIEAAGRNRGRIRQEALADLFDHRDAVIRVDDLLSNSKSHSNLRKQTRKRTAGWQIIEKTLEKINSTSGAGPSTDSALD